MKSIKKTLCLFLTILMMVSAITPVMANNNITVKIDGQQIAFDVQPQLINGRTMVPLRAIFEALGATVDWNNNTQTVTSTKGGTTISLTINNPTMYVNGAAVTLDSPACLVGGRTLVPVRAISEAFGTTVDWDNATSTVIISTYVKETTTLYAADGRTIEVLPSEIEPYKAVGWFVSPVVTMYAADGRTIQIANIEIEEYKAVGWYTEPMTTMYALDGRTQVVPQNQVEANKAVGWYTEADYNSYYFYPTDVISEKVPKFDIAVGGSFKNQDNSKIQYYSKSSPTYWYNADFDKAAAYQKILKQYGWEQDGFTDFNYETKIVNNTIKQIARSFSVFFEKGNIKLHFYYSYKTGNVSISYYIY